jgi:hypothetical protein
MVLLLGQYSVGKTSFIKFLLERDFPGSAQRSLFESVYLVMHWSECNDQPSAIVLHTVLVM